jgi:uncharacterized protein YfbU (UPF0304 family)
MRSDGKITTIRLPNGRSCSIARYVAAWRTLRDMKPNARVEGFDYFMSEACDVLRRMREGMHDRINKHDPAYGKGRRWSEQWQTSMRRDCNAVRDYRQHRIVRPGSGLELAEMQHRFHDVHERFRNWRD